MDTSHHPSPASTEGFVQELLRCTGALMLIVDHMARYSASHGPASKDLEPPDVVLASLLCDLLAPEIGRLDEDRVAAATALLAQTVQTVEDEILLVPPPTNRAARRSNRRRPRRPRH